MTMASWPSFLQLFKDLPVEHYLCAFILQPPPPAPSLPSHPTLTEGSSVSKKEPAGLVWFHSMAAYFWVRLRNLYILSFLLGKMR